MLELSKLASSLDVGEGQGIDTLDPRFQDIASLIEQADFAQAARKCQETFEEVGGDIRLIAWFFFGLVLQDGVAALGPSLELATNIFRDRFESVGPERKKDRHATSGMSWFLGKLADRLTSDDPDLQAEAARLAARATLEQVQAAIAASDELSEAFPTAIPAAEPTKVTNQLRRVREWLEGLERELTPAPKAENPEPDLLDDDGDDGDGDDDGDEPRSQRGGSGSPFSGLQVDASPQLAELQARIAAFEALIARGDVAKASVIASDVMEVVAHFDPRVYLPRLFGGFFAQFARQAGDVLTWQEKRGSAPWAIYDQLYRTDLESFMRSGEADFQRMLSNAPSGPPPSYAQPSYAQPAYAQPAYAQPSHAQPPPAAFGSNPPRPPASAEDDEDVGPSTNDDW